MSAARALVRYTGINVKLNPAAADFLMKERRDCEEAEGVELPGGHRVGVAPAGGVEW